MSTDPITAIYGTTEDEYLDALYEHRMACLDQQHDDFHAMESFAPDRLPQD